MIFLSFTIFFIPNAVATHMRFFYICIEWMFLMLSHICICKRSYTYILFGEYGWKMVSALTCSFVVCTLFSTCLRTRNTCQHSAFNPDCYCCCCIRRLRRRWRFRCVSAIATVAVVAADCRRDGVSLLLPFFWNITHKHSHRKWTFSRYRKTKHIQIHWKFRTLTHTHKHCCFGCIFSCVCDFI